MQWRMLARRCPSGSMTLVGDPGQASRPGALTSWTDVLAHVPQHTPARFVTLTINYRTPSEVMDVATRLLAVAAPTVEPSRSVRSTGEQPLFVPTSADRLLDETTDRARAALARTGTVAVIAPAPLHAEIIDRLADVGASTDATEALDAAVAVLEPAEAKGLEFDHVVVVEPARLVTADRAGLRLLYVTITRTTKTLTVVHAESLPEGLANRVLEGRGENTRRAYCRGCEAAAMVDLDNPRYPRSSTYPAAFHLASCMGPNVLWLTEALCEVMTLEPGMRVLDLGCGRAASSIFIAREFGVQVIAADLWIAPTENWKRIVEAGCESHVIPLRAEAHDLAFAHGYFDAIGRASTRSTTSAATTPTSACSRRSSGPAGTSASWYPASATRATACRRTSSRSCSTATTPCTRPVGGASTGRRAGS